MSASGYDFKDEAWLEAPSSQILERTLLVGVEHLRHKPERLSLQG